MVDDHGGLILTRSGAAHTLSSRVEARASGDVGRQTSAHAVGWQRRAMSDRTTRVRRQASIRELVRDRRVQSQDELVELLLARGVAVTQSTLSRDLRELRIARVPYGDGYRYVEAADGGDGDDASIETRRLLATIAPIEVVEVLANEVSVVVRTLPGRAQGVAALIDRLGLDEVLATLAGDDTVLVIPRTVRAVDALRVHLAAALGLA